MKNVTKCLKILNKTKPVKRLKIYRLDKKHKHHQDSRIREMRNSLLGYSDNTKSAHGPKIIYSYILMKCQ